MPDYGHELRFGAGLDSYSHHTEHLVSLAEAADRAGLDLVAVADHPYQPAFLETWTLLSYLAAATSRTRLAANVHPIPLRPPAMLARSAATLDILSGGRFELGLGAGHFWDAIETMGGPRRTPAQAVEALEEGVQVIRAVLDTTAQDRVSFEGRHYQARGLRRGPRPAHDIEIWIGAYGPRMLRLTGRLADGWLPSLPAFDHPRRLAEGNAVVDDAAAQAGRSPRDIRRLLNIGDELPAEQVAELALRDGFSTFNYQIADHASLYRLAQEIAPAARELVASERDRRGTAG